MHSHLFKLENSKVKHHESWPSVLQNFQTKVTNQALRLQTLLKECGCHVPSGTQCQVGDLASEASWLLWGWGRPGILNTGVCSRGHKEPPHLWEQRNSKPDPVTHCLRSSYSKVHICLMDSHGFLRGNGVGSRQHICNQRTKLGYADDHVV